MSGKTNIDDMRARIMELENAKIFDSGAWANVLSKLADRPAAMADAQRRMQTAMMNAQAVVIYQDAVAVEAEVGELSHG